jgi:hypothetical protein
MTQRTFVCTDAQGKHTRILAGYDRRLDEYFLSVFGGDDQFEPSYATISDPQLVGADLSDMNLILGKLDELGLRIPREMVVCLDMDRVLGEGNVFRDHTPGADLDDLREIGEMLPSQEGAIVVNTPRNPA